MTSKKYLDLNKENPEIYAKQQEYLKYIEEHIYNVERAWRTIKRTCVTYLAYKCNASDFIFINDLISKHDLSKYSKEEFEPYRKNFYPINEQEKQNNKESFEKAWEHHYMMNPHHWDYWAADGRENEMPFTYVVEMICDWQAMGYKFGNTPKEYYEKNKNNIILGKIQEEWIYELFYRMEK